MPSLGTENPKKQMQTQRAGQLYRFAGDREERLPLAVAMTTCTSITFADCLFPNRTAMLQQLGIDPRAIRSGTHFSFLF